MRITPRRVGLKEKKASADFEIARERLAKIRKGLPKASLREDYVKQGPRLRRRALLISAPENFSFEDNYDESIGFIYDFIWYTTVRDPSIKTGSMSADLKSVSAIGLEAALILVSEYHRSILKTPGRKPWIDDSEWHPVLRALLEQLGFYELVEACGRSEPQSVPVDFKQKFVPFISGQAVEGELVAKLIDSMKNAAGQTPRRVATYGAVVEAMKNVKNHAYPPDAPPQTTFLAPYWWAAGAYDTEADTLTFAMYDQGVGIPATLTPKSLFQAIRELCPPEFNDADVLAGAIEFGRTSTDLQGRGNGLWTICKLVEELEGSKVRILSGRGDVTYFGPGQVEKKLHAKPFCGTLVQWHLQLAGDKAEASQ